MTAPNPDDLLELAALYALHALSDEDAAALERRVEASDPATAEAFRAEARTKVGVLDALRDAAEDLDWFMVSPAAGYGAYAPGERTGSYRVGGDVLLTDDAGTSFISA